MSASAKLVARLLGFIAGVGVAAGFVVTGITPASNLHLGAQVTFQTLPSGELAIQPEGRFLEASSLDPGGLGDAARGVTNVTNQSAVPLSLRTRVLPSSHNLDDLLRVRIDANGKRMFNGKLGALREWTKGSFRLAPGHDTDVVVRAWLPRSVQEGYEARGTKLTMIWKTHPVVWE